MLTVQSQQDATLQKRLTGVTLAALGAGLFSLKGVVIKLAFGQGVSVDQLLTLRMAFSLPFYLVVGVFAWRRLSSRPSLKMLITAASLGILSYYVSSYLNFMGLRYVSAQLERLILYIYPTMVALLAWIAYRQPVTWRHMAALVLAYAGVVILFSSEIGRLGSQAWLGGGLIFAGAFLYAVYVTASKPVIAKMGSLMFTSFAMSSASLLFLIQAAFTSVMTPAEVISWQGVGLSLILATVCTVAPSFMIAEAINRLGPGPMSAIGGVGPVIAAWAAVAILHEPFGWAHLFSMSLTIAGVWLLAKDGPRQAKPAET